MRLTRQLLAAVERNSRFLEVGAPTGLTGLLTHGSPRSTLLYLYSSTLDKLKEFPEHSVYRQATEALTKQRMQVVESVKPAGLEQWQQRVDPLVLKHPEAIRKIKNSSSSSNGEYNIVWKERDVGPASEDAEGPDGEARSGAVPAVKEGASWSQEEVDRIARSVRNASAVAEDVLVEIEPEPALTRDQIEEIEGKLNAGLIEEVIQVAEAEQELVDVMFKNKV